jgi:hypothetical protein
LKQCQVNRTIQKSFTRLIFPDLITGKNLIFTPSNGNFTLFHPWQARENRHMAEKYAVLRTYRFLIPWGQIGKGQSERKRLMINDYWELTGRNQEVKIPALYGRHF